MRSHSFPWHSERPRFPTFGFPLPVKVQGWAAMFLCGGCPLAISFVDRCHPPRGLITLFLSPGKHRARVIRVFCYREEPLDSKNDTLKEIPINIVIIKFPTITITNHYPPLPPILYRHKPPPLSTIITIADITNHCQRISTRSNRYRSWSYPWPLPSGPGLAVDHSLSLCTGYIFMAIWTAPWTSCEPPRSMSGWP